MKPLIDTTEVYNAYIENCKKRDPYENYKDWFSRFPDVIKQIIELDRFIQPKHFSNKLLKHLLICNCKKLEPSFLNDEYTEPVINAICQYLRKDPAFLTIAKGYSFDKGIILHGKVGSGKTLLMRALSNLLEMFSNSDYNYNIRFKLVESWKISAEFMKGGFEKAISFTTSYDRHICLNTENICIDDIGSEQIASHFGNTVNVIGEIFMNRYSETKENRRYSITTYATTNLDAAHLKAFYGDRVFSRMKELLNDMVLSGNDRRK